MEVSTGGLVTGHEEMEEMQPGSALKRGDAMEMSECIERTVPVVQKKGGRVGEGRAGQGETLV